MKQRLVRRMSRVTKHFFRRCPPTAMLAKELGIRAGALVKYSFFTTAKTH